MPAASIGTGYKSKTQKTRITKYYPYLVTGRKGDELENVCVVPGIEVTRQLY
jgi:hypothetical protein